jgi:hypothetical protein
MQQLQFRRVVQAHSGADSVKDQAVSFESGLFETLRGDYRVITRILSAGIRRTGRAGIPTDLRHQKIP